MTELTEAFISRVFLTYRGTLIPEGLFPSPYPPAGTLMFRWTPVEQFAVAAHKAVEMNLIRDTDEFWDYIRSARTTPTWWSMCPYPVLRFKGLSGVVEKSLVCSDPISAVPLDVEEEDA